MYVDVPHLGLKETSEKSISIQYLGNSHLRFRVWYGFSHLTEPFNKAKINHVTILQSEKRPTFSVVLF